ncbi:tetratricopeptide repeat protein [Micromonospora sp. C95]|uniref:tetratricopeptide repeat protein n=1 Tax=Micromonospora sp. C95 TaxID=2824882 RepID=UPI001B39190D|nr:tetratricopeptide repeat protein [Micromonospora sp. C95]MBQ1023838.1 tetratricopeptide repeat protein [Micromonospora sp. C95]
MGGQGRLQQHRCTLVVAAAGYGKTSAVRARLRDRAVHWFDGADAGPLVADCPQRLADLGARCVQDPSGRDPVWLVLDDVPQLSHRQLRALVDTVDALPHRLRVAVLTRHPPAMLRHPTGMPAELGPADLALTTEQVAAVLVADHGTADPTLAARVHAATAGWPVLVALAAKSAGVSGVDLDDLAGPGTAVESYLMREVLAGLPAEADRLLRDAAHLDPVLPDLCRHLGHRRACHLLTWLTRAGIVAPAAVGGQEYRVVPVVADVVRRCLPLTVARRTQLYARSATWYADGGHLVPALRSYGRCGAVEATVRLLAEHGATMLASGGAATIDEACRSLPGWALTPSLRLLHGEALQIRGDFDAALAAYDMLAARQSRLVAALAWRYGLVHYLRGEPDRALDIFRRGRLDPLPTTDNVRLLAWTAAAYWTTGDATACRDHARRALTAAVAVGGDDALAAAHAALALAAKLTGDRCAADEHHEKALRSAEAARDTVQVTRIRANRASALVGESRYAEALAQLRPAVELAESNGYAAMLALTLCNEGTAYFHLGQPAQALACYERAVPILQRMGSHKVAYALVGIGEVHALRGRGSLARAAFEEALRASEPVNDLQALVPALAGLARVLAAEDGATAITMAQRAVALERGPDSAAARLALGWVALETGDRDRAVKVASTAAEAARRHRDHAALAEALELRGAATTDLDDTRRAWREAAVILRDIQAQVAADRLAVLLGRLPRTGPQERAAGHLAAARLTAVGVPPPGVGGRHHAARVRIRTLGGFELRVNGEPVPATAWQSRKAQDLLRILAARRGRPVPREQLGELLWPDQDPGRVSHRLSVALSTLRSVLDPDRRAPTDHFVVAAHASLTLDLGHVELDIEQFVTDAAHGLRLVEQGAVEDARTVLLLTEQLYRGDFLEDTAYEDWATPTRDEARRVYLRVVRTLASLARQRCQLDETVRLLSRALEVEPHDERVHGEFVGTLVAAGRHGEADLAYRRYADAMSAIGVRPRTRGQLDGVPLRP